MNILSMLVRLQSVLGCPDLVNQMVLLPHATPDTDVINLVVGYSNSPKSQTALDLTLWIAHQTRLATGKQVTVQVVYVVDDRNLQKIPVFETSKSRQMERDGGGRTAVAELDSQPSGMIDLFEKADRILWQARCLAEEWRGSLKTHLRFGAVDTELQSVVEAESASLLILGCESKDHALVDRMVGLPCPVLGIPVGLND